MLRVSLSDLAASLADELDSVQDWTARLDDFDAPSWKWQQAARLRDELEQAVDLEQLELISE